MVNGLSYWLRWVAVLPGALIGGLLATFPLHWVLYLAFARNGSLFGFIELPLGSNIPVEYALTPFVIAVTFILVGDKIAPTHKFQTSIILTILLVSFFIGVLIFMPDQAYIQVRGIGSPLGALLGLFISWKNSKRKISEAASSPAI
ncbi:MAG: hypothetical protein UY22_C0043G0006 [Candidatus Amesbacteria bacterium GW2011_GWC1_48_10]|uniref:Uncharacterized protein n=2 Tax=Patescibacteria group TaxID=1783273 RepID=A0A0G1XAN4_9BACT|nr:MAG: hypothetical protein UY22_C0043G0006 [Candidatus Amesbacteria bacterium GW2011_GWC1_48_10]KKW22753.1 MAG: hypothetical protein UY67_C0036G0003 [Candidatus Kaiserbacteria bacterium GW2011_GWA2_52_12]